MRLSADDIDRLTASSAQRGAWTVADAIIAGDAPAAIRTFLALRQQGERVAGLLYQISMRVRTAEEVAAAIERGEPQAKLKRTLRMPSRAADRLIEDARRIGAERLRELTGEIADLELASRGGGSGGVGEDTAAISLIAGLGSVVRCPARAAGPSERAADLRPDVLDALVRDVGVDHQVDGAEHDGDHQQREEPQDPAPLRAQRRVDGAIGPGRRRQLVVALLELGAQTGVLLVQPARRGALAIERLLKRGAALAL